MKILIVDDSLAMRRMMLRTLRMAGYGEHEVIAAANGRAGLEAAQSEAPDMILSDWKMPEMDGLEFLAALRQGGSRTPFGFITTDGNAAMRDAARAAGADFLLEKPFSPEKVGAALDPILG